MKSLLAVLVVLTVPSAAAAQALLTPGPPGPYVIDLRVGTVKFPNVPRFYPPVPAGTLAPARGLGFDAGAHVYAGHVGKATLGFGVALARLTGTASTPTPRSSSSGSSTATTTTAPTRPDVSAALTAVMPQVSFNFGTRDGWSYVSAGLGTSRMKTETSGSGSVTVSTGNLRTINAGGGARWFMSSHLAVGFDIRMLRMAAGENATPASMVWVIGGGISVR